MNNVENILKALLIAVNVFVLNLDYILFFTILSSPQGEGQTWDVSTDCHSSSPRWDLAVEESCNRILTNRTCFSSLHVLPVLMNALASCQALTGNLWTKNFIFHNMKRQIKIFCLGP